MIFALPKSFRLYVRSWTRYLWCFFFILPRCTRHSTFLLLEFSSRCTSKRDKSPLDLIPSQPNMSHINKIPNVNYLLTQRIIRSLKLNPHLPSSSSSASQHSSGSTASSSSHHSVFALDQGLYRFKLSISSTLKSTFLSLERRTYCGSGSA